MLNTIITNIQIFGYLMLLFVGAYLSNILLGTFYNIKNLHEYFEKDIMLDGLKKGLCIIVSFILIIVVVGTLPEVAKLAGIQTDVVSGVSLLSIATIIITASVKYLKDALTKLYKIISNQTAEESEPELDEDGELPLD